MLRLGLPEYIFLLHNGLDMMMRRLIDCAVKCRIIYCGGGNSWLVKCGHTSISLCLSQTSPRRTNKANVQESFFNYKYVFEPNHFLSFLFPFLCSFQCSIISYQTIHELIRRYDLGFKSPVTLRCTAIVTVFSFSSTGNRNPPS